MPGRLVHSQRMRMELTMQCVLFELVSLLVSMQLFVNTNDDQTMAKELTLPLKEIQSKQPVMVMATKCLAVSTPIH